MNQATTLRVTILCADAHGHYPKLANELDLDVWTAERDVNNYRGTGPVIAHPPCAQWGRLRQLAKPDEALKRLGIFCGVRVERYGGVLEHPAGSLLWDAMCWPKPGEEQGDLTTIEVDQIWWGYPARKRTWLLLSRIPLSAVQAPLILKYPTHCVDTSRRDSGRLKLIGKRQRSETCPDLVRWLVDLARKVEQ